MEGGLRSLGLGEMEGAGVKGEGVGRSGENGE
jgi:hypothetical protein